MKKVFSFKKLSRKFAFIIFAFVVVVAGIVAFYMETRIMSEIERYIHLNFRHQINDLKIQSDLAFLDAVYGVAAMKSFVEANFDVAEYQADAGGYFDNKIKATMVGFVSNIIDNSDFVWAAYFAVHPDLAGYPLVNEVYFEKSDSGIVAPGAQSYEEYMQTDSEEMEWFYGAYKSAKPYWSSIYEWMDGTVMISYSEPVYVDGKIIGIAGVDISISDIEALVKNAKLYDTGFFIIKDIHGDFFESNEIIKGFNSAERNTLSSTAAANLENIFEVRVGDIGYYGTSTVLINDYELILMAPMREVDAEANASILRFIIIFTSALVIVLVVAFIIGNNISKPLVAISNFMRRAASSGDLATHDSDADLIGRYAQIKDETGQIIRDCFAFIEHVTHISKELETVAKGDLTADINMISDADVMGRSLRYMVDSLNSLFDEIGQSSAQVASGSKQIADGSQSLAQGATQQAASVEELSASVSDVARKTKENAEMAGRAAKLADTIKGNAEMGSRQMGEMMTAVKEINQASQNIQKVIKAIDDIAFQTNILALNAAVEAARAGQHGKGFAVVAEEVRSLAAKSAEAAKETDSLIANSMEKAEMGSRIAGETSTSLAQIVSGINESSDIITEIAKSSEEQSAGIDQINTGIDQVTQVVQQTSATAEESAAASEEMSGQSDMLKEMISQFKLKGGSVGRNRLPGAKDAGQKGIAAPKKAEYAPDFDNGNFGKY